MEHEISQTDNGFDLFMKEAARRGSSIVRIPKIPWLTFEQFKDTGGGIPIDPELMECIRIPFNWKRFLYHRLCSFTIQSILENGLITGGHESDKFNLSWRMD